MACDTICIFHLQGIVIGVIGEGSQSLRDFTFAGSHHDIAKSVHLVCRNRGAFTHEASKHHLGRKDRTIGERQLHLGEITAIYLFGFAHPSHLGGIAIGYETGSLIFSSPIVVIFRDYYPIAPFEGFLGEEHHISDSTIKIIGTTIRTSDDNGVIHADLSIRIGEGVGEVGRRYSLDIVHAGESECWDTLSGRSFEARTHDCSVEHDSGIGSLSYREIE